MPLPRQFRRPALVMCLAAVVPLAACGTLPLGGDGLDREVPTQIVLETAGGIASIRDHLTLDSPTRDWVRVSCRLLVSLADCKDSQSSGRVTEATRDSLVSMATQADFRTLSGDYPVPQTVPDGFGYSLVLRSAAGSHTITWADGSDIPEALRRFHAVLISINLSPNK